MLSRGVSALGRRAPQFGSRQPVRGMATEQQLRIRIQSVKNIQKITAAMKMVAASKLRGAQDVLARAREFQKSVDDVWIEPPKDVAPKSQLYVAITSDRGLCGAINSSIARSVRDSMIQSEESGIADVRLMCIGEKGKQTLERAYAKNLTTTLSETARFKPCTFKQCAELTDFWLKEKTDKTSVYFQLFKSMIAYETTEDPYYSFETYKDLIGTEFAEYEMEGDPDMLENLYEFRACVKLFYYFAEAETSTLSARMTAMDNSANNAADMIDSLNLVLNRNRQAKITTELSEIISGAAAVDEVG